MIQDVRLLKLDKDEALLEKID